MFDRYFQWILNSLLTPFSSQHFKDVSLLSLAYRFSSRKRAEILNFVSLYIMHPFSLAVFKIFPLPLVCSNLMIICLHVLFVFVYALLGVL